MLCIFDLDGTLVNSIADLADSCNRSLAKRGYPTHADEAYYVFVGDGIRKTIERALPEEARTDAIIDEIKEEFDAYYPHHLVDKSRPYDGIKELLCSLKKRGETIAVLSNKANEFSNQVCCALFDEGTFDLVCGIGGEIAAKPSPVGITHILNTFGMDAGEAVLIGDTKTDIATAKNANIRCVGAVWGFRDEAELIGAGADVLAATPSDVIDALQKIGF